MCAQKIISVLDYCCETAGKPRNKEVKEVHIGCCEFKSAIMQTLLGAKQY